MCRRIKFACVRFIDEKKKSFCVPIDLIKVKNFERNLVSFRPENALDFDKTAIYFIKWHCHNECYEDHEHNGYYRAQISFLASKKN